MSQAFPIVRAGVLVPFLRWMRANGLALDGPLRAADLPEPLGDDPDRLVALAGVLPFAQALAHRTGPDIGCRVVSEASVADLGSLGRVMLGAPTPREALVRLAAAMNRHCTHELFALVPTRDGAFFREQITLGMDAEIRHIQHQYVASLVRSLCVATGYSGQPFGRVVLAPIRRPASIIFAAGSDPISCPLAGRRCRSSFPRPSSTGRFRVGAGIASLYPRYGPRSEATRAMPAPRRSSSPRCSTTGNRRCSVSPPPPAPERVADASADGRPAGAAAGDEETRQPGTPPA